jgi:hypothetical protein
MSEDAVYSLVIAFQKHITLPAANPFRQVFEGPTLLTELVDRFLEPVFINEHPLIFVLTGCADRVQARSHNVPEQQDADGGEQEVGESAGRHEPDSISFGWLIMCGLHEPAGSREVPMPTREINRPLHRWSNTREGRANSGVALGIGGRTGAGAPE